MRVGSQGYCHSALLGQVPVAFSGLRVVALAPLTLACGSSLTAPCHGTDAGRFDAAATATAEVNESDEDLDVADGAPERNTPATMLERCLADYNGANRTRGSI